MGAPCVAPCISQLELLLSKSSNLFYQKSLTNHSVGVCGEEKGFKGKGNRRRRLRVARPAIRRASLPAKFFATEKKERKEDTFGPTHPFARVGLLPKFDTGEIYDKITLQIDKRRLYWSRDPGVESQNALRKLTVKCKQSVSATERSMRITQR